MSFVDPSNDPNTPDNGQPAPVSDPADRWQIRLVGCCFVAFAIVVFYLLIATWPVPGPKPEDGFKPFNIFGSGPIDWSPDLRLFLTVAAAGALGSLVHTFTSFADYVGNKRLSKNWIWWFILRAPIGIALALIFYLVLRGGLIVPTLPSGSTQNSTAQILNPYGFAAVAALSGMFSKQAADKLREIFEAMFTPQKAVKRADPLAGAKLAISKVEPPKLTKDKPEVLIVTGTGFQRGCTATINDNDRSVEWVSDTQVKVTPAAEDVAVAGAGKVQLVVQNPEPNGGTSEAFPIDVV